MATLKYSRQRASIKEYLLQTHEHPTADTVYLHVKKEFPNISLGTVYRNLNLLADMGEAQKIPTPNGGDRFDGRTDFHYHVICTSCGNVSDLELSLEHITEINQLANRHFDGQVESHSMIFKGLCPHCLKNKINIK
ncbi:MAG: transcriptional repressor [Dorea sp.]|jgi:Fe2+ or Zn2+ uptake regulation protein|nr:transcriptional repressor [Dorea sp.]